MSARRAQRTTAIAVLVGLGIVLLNLALGLLYRDTRRGIEAELGARLESVVALLGELVDSDLVARAALEPAAASRADSLPGLPAQAASDSLRSRLRTVVDAVDLANVRVYDASGTAFLEIAAAGRPATTAELDPASVLAALTGSTVHGEPFESGGEFLMTGYAPVRDAGGAIVAAIAVEADARFFASVRRLRFATIGIAMLSALVLVGLGLGFARMQASLERAEIALQRAETLAAMGRLAAGIAHEIRNPLGIINATAARLKRRYDDPVAPDERFDYIAEEVDRMNGILTGYLNFARDEPSILRALDLVPVLQRSLRLAAPELEAAHIDLQVEAPASCAIRGDAQRLQQVVLNLVLNAVQAMSNGGRLRVRLRASGDDAALEFTDSGPGFAAGSSERWFEPFVTTKEKGSGLGLTVARRIVEEHGGRIALGAAADTGGARVEVTLPLAER